MNDLVAQLTIEDIQTELQYAQPTNFKVVLQERKMEECILVGSKWLPKQQSHFLATRPQHTFVSHKVYCKQRQVPFLLTSILWFPHVSAFHLHICNHGRLSTCGLRVRPTLIFFYPIHVWIYRYTKLPDAKPLQLAGCYSIGANKFLVRQFDANWSRRGFPPFHAGHF